VPPLDADDQVKGLERAAGDRYRVYLDGTDRRRRLRYVAIARTLNFRPYAVVTSDPAELLQALGCPDIAAAAPPARRPAR
jgi:hypothetical protein